MGMPVLKGACLFQTHLAQRDLHGGNEFRRAKFNRGPSNTGLKLAWLDILGERGGTSEAEAWMAGCVFLKPALDSPSRIWCSVRMTPEGGEDKRMGKIRKWTGEDAWDKGHTSPAPLYHSKTANHRTAADKLLQHNYFLSQKCPRLSIKLLLLEALSVFTAKSADFGKGEIISIPAIGSCCGRHCGCFWKCCRQQWASSYGERQQHYREIPPPRSNKKVKRGWNNEI